MVFNFYRSIIKLIDKTYKMDITGGRFIEREKD